jgi:hypothetical protein
MTTSTYVQLDTSTAKRLHAAINAGTCTLKSRKLPLKDGSERWMMTAKFSNTLWIYNPAEDIGFIPEAITDMEADLLAENAGLIEENWFSKRPEKRERLELA